MTGKTSKNNKYIYTNILYNRFKHVWVHKYLSKQCTITKKLAEYGDLLARVHLIEKHPLHKKKQR